jgi:hypothetical protein
MAGVAADNDGIVAAAVGRRNDLAIALLEQHIDAMTEVILEVTHAVPGRFMGPAIYGRDVRHLRA